MRAILKNDPSLVSFHSLVPPNKQTAGFKLTTMTPEPAVFLLYQSPGSDLLVDLLLGMGS